MSLTAWRALTAVSVALAVIAWVGVMHLQLWVLLIWPVSAVAVLIAWAWMRVRHPEPPPVCRVCGCTDHDCSRCVAVTGAPCWWIEDDLCSRCAT